MTLMPKIYETDGMYKFYAERFSGECLDFLNKQVSFPDDIRCFQRFSTILEDMELETPFRASHPSKEDWSIGDRFYYRRPVWQAIFETINSVMIRAGHTPFSDQKECARFLKEQFQLLHRHVKFVNWMEKSRSEMVRMGLLVSFKGDAEAHVCINFNQGAVGAKAKRILKFFFKDLHKKLEQIK